MKCTCLCKLKCKRKKGKPEKTCSIINISWYDTWSMFWNLGNIGDVSKVVLMFQESYGVDVTLWPDASFK